MIYIIIWLYEIGTICYCYVSLYHNFRYNSNWIFCCALNLHHLTWRSITLKRTERHVFFITEILYIVQSFLFIQKISYTFSHFLHVIHRSVTLPHSPTKNLSHSSAIYLNSLLLKMSSWKIFFPFDLPMKNGTWFNTWLINIQR